MAREAYLSFPEFPLNSLRKQKRCCFSVFTYLVSSKWRTYHNDRSSGRHDFIRRKRYLARWTHRPLWHNRDKLKNTEIAKQTGWHECQYVFIQCRNSSTTDWDFSGPALRRKPWPGKEDHPLQLNSKRLYEKKVDSLLGSNQELITALAHALIQLQRFWATDVNRKWTLCIIGQWFGWNSWVNRLYKRKET